MVAETSRRIKPPLHGVRFDIPSSALPPEYMSECLNFFVQDHVVVKRPGRSLLGTNLPLASVPIGFYQFKTFTGNIYTVAFTLNDILALDSVTNLWQSIKGEVTWAPTAGTLSSHTFINNRMIATNGVDQMVMWDGVSPTVSVVPESSAYRAQHVDQFWNRLVMFNMIESGNEVPIRVRWTRIGTYDDFTTGYAGFSDLADTPGRILTARKFGELEVIYKEDAILLMSYVGGAKVFNFNVVVAGKGLAARNALVDMGDKHLFVSNDNVYEFWGGREPTPVGDAIKDYITRASASEYFSRTVGIRLNSLAIFFVPVESAYPDKAFVYDTRNGDWGVWDIGCSAVGYYQRYVTFDIGDLTTNIGGLNGIIGDFSSSSIGDRLVICSADGNIRCLLLFASVDDTGTQIEGYWTTGDLIEEENDRVLTNRYRNIYVDAKGDSLRVEFSVDEGRTWRGAKTVTLDTGYKWYKVDMDCVAEKIRFKFSSTTGSVWFRGAYLNMLRDVKR